MNGNAHGAADAAKAARAEPAAIAAPATSAGDDSSVGGRRPLPADHAALPARRVVSESSRKAVDAARASSEFELKSDQCVNCRTAGVRARSMPSSSCAHIVLCEGCYSSLEAACRGNAQLAEMMRRSMCPDCRAT